MNKSRYEINDVGVKRWFNPTGQLHREDGPAYINSWNKSWYLNGYLHRMDGPSIEYTNGDKAWYFNGKYIDCNSQEEFERLLRLKAFW